MENDEIYFEKLKLAVDPADRIQIANDINCPIVILQIFCVEELDIRVVEAAILNPHSPDESVQTAFDRFPSLNNSNITRLREKKKLILERMNEIKELEEEAKKSLSGDRDQVIMNHILEKKELLKKPNHATMHLGTPHKGDNIVFRNPEIEWAPTSKYRIAFAMLPSWGVLFPPYNLAKLTGLLRKHDYSVKVYDVNVEAYHWFLENHGQDYWRSERHFLWEVKENFEKYLLPDLAPIIDKIIDDIIVSDIRVLGFSMYTTNRNAVIYMAKIIRQLFPDLCIMAGGPETITTPHIFDNEARDVFNYIFIGESEENLLYILENLPEKLPFNERIGTLKSRLNLDTFAYPDYSDYDIRNYLDNGVSIETSRGCVAQCSFCAETYFWKFRSLTPERVVDEMEYQINKHNIERFWFVDSLVNGNIKSFERLVDLIRERKLRLNWNSYARCDGRMDITFFRKIRHSGCTALSFGVESGSQKVLDDMRKKIEVWEIENNLRDGKYAGMFNHVNWMLGFPTEEAIDHFHSMQLLFNIRKWVAAISPGMSAGLASNSHLETDYDKYGIVGKEKIYDTTFMGQWYTEGYKNTILHRFLRVKFMHIWLKMMNEHTEASMSNSQEYLDIKDYYTFEFSSDSKILEYMEQDYKVDFNQRGTDYRDSIAAEYIGFCYLLYKYFGECKFTMLCDYEKDIKTFGDFLVRPYTSQVDFNVNQNGDYVLTLNHKLDHAAKKYLNDIRKTNMSFTDTFTMKGNISDWQTDTPQIRETIHEQYRRR